MQKWSWLAVGVWLFAPLAFCAEDSAIPDPQWRVARAQFTSAIENREPVDRLVVASPLIGEVYFFTDLRHLDGRTVTHRWKHEGTVVSVVPFKVGGPRWRVYSKKVIEPDEIGTWSVTVIDESGWPLYTELFRYENGAPLIQPANAAVASGAQGADAERDQEGLRGDSGASAVPASSPAADGAGSQGSLSP